MRGLLIVMLLACTANLQAQVSAPAIRGRVTRADGTPASDVLVRAFAGAARVETRTDSAGAYRLTGLNRGEWVVVVRALGYQPDSSRVHVTGDDVTHDVRLQRLPVELDRQIVNAEWVGVRGVVGTRDYEAVPGALISVAGKRNQVRSSADGQFALELPKNQSLLLRIAASGFVTRLISIRTEDRGAQELSVLLDSLKGAKVNTVLASEMESRMNWASPMSGRATREELLRYGVKDLVEAASLASGLVSKGLVLNRNACVFVDGVAKPGWPLDAIDPRTVEFIEAYGPGDDRSGTLDRRWPPSAPCGAGVDARFSRSGGRNRGVRYVVVWTRQP